LTVPADWWQTFFSGLSVEMWLGAITEEQTRAEVDFLQEALRLTPGARALDVPCGGGRHAVELAAHGYRVFGVDIAPDFLKAARERARQQNVTVTWEEREMRDLPWQGEFDAAYCCGNSFGYFDDAGNADFLHSVARILRPGGRFVLEYGAVAETLLPALKDRNWYEIGDILFLIKNQHVVAQSRLETECRFIRGSQVERKSFCQRIYTYAELSALLTAAGFVELEAFGSYKREPFQLKSPNLIVTATRRGS
jgi:SAM-dependent methyltransferase